MQLFSIIPLKGVISGLFFIPKDPKESIEKAGPICTSDLLESTSVAVLLGAESFRVESDRIEFLVSISLEGSRF